MLGAAQVIRGTVRLTIEFLLGAGRTSILSFKGVEGEDDRNALAKLPLKLGSA